MFSVILVERKQINCTNFPRWRWACCLNAAVVCFKPSTDWIIQWLELDEGKKTTNERNAFPTNFPAQWSQMHFRIVSRISCTTHRGPITHPGAKNKWVTIVNWIPTGKKKKNYNSRCWQKFLEMFKTKTQKLRTQFAFWVTADASRWIFKSHLWILKEHIFLIRYQMLVVVLSFWKFKFHPLKRMHVV